MPVLDSQALINNRVTAIRDMHTKAGIARAELDLSGGVDSAVMLGLLTKALGPENVTTAFLGINSSPDAQARAQEVSNRFGCNLIVLDLTDTYEQLIATMKKGIVESLLNEPEQHGDRRMWEILLEQRLANDPTILGSIRSCLRAPVGRGLNRMTCGGIRHGTGNECEDRWMRFYQKGGDGEVDTNPIAMLSKGEVFQLARALEVPRSILEARPSPDLWGVGETGHNDEDEIAKYLGFKAGDYGQSFYSYVNPDTGAYTNVGLIERLSRWCDARNNDLFRDNLSPEDLGALINDVAVFDREWLGMPQVDKVVPVLLSHARKIERSSRHKMNPNCPALGCRADLVAAGILTDELPVDATGYLTNERPV